MEEKRKSPRAENSIIVQYAQNSSEPLKHSSWDYATIKNISTEGIYFNSNRNFAKNDKLRLRFIMPTAPFDRLEVEGEVVESLVYRTRAKFINLKQDQKKLISDYVGYLLAKNKYK